MFQEMPVMSSGGGGGDTERVIYAQAFGAYVGSFVSIDEVQKFKYAKTLTTAEFQTYIGASVGSINFSSVYMTCLNAGGTTQHTYTLTGTDTDLTSLDLSNTVAVNFSIDGSGSTWNGWAVMLHN